MHVDARGQQLAVPKTAADTLVLITSRRGGHKEWANNLEHDKAVAEAAQSATAFHQEMRKKRPDGYLTKPRGWQATRLAHCARMADVGWQGRLMAGGQACIDTSRPHAPPVLGQVAHRGSSGRQHTSNPPLDPGFHSRVIRVLCRE